MSELTNLKNVSELDRKMIEDAEMMMGPEPEEMGFIKNLFWGRFRNDLIFPYPESSDSEQEKCEKLLLKLNEYLENEHPSVQIDREEEIPQWVLDRLFEMGVMGMTIPEEYGGLGLGVTSYNRILAAIGAKCAGTSVVVSAHQSIGCKALMLFGTETQKKKYLPFVAKEKLSAFCLSEPNVGCDAAGQETHCKLSKDGKYYILNGEKKWITSGAFAGLYTVMAKQTYLDKKSGVEKEGITALIVDPTSEGVEVFQKNRSKCGIRGTWQARILFNDVKVPVENLLHKEGRGLQVALTCLNYGRCTLSAGTYGAAVTAMNQGVKWATTRYQFQRPLADFELVQQKIARMSAYTYAMDAVLYMMTGMLDRADSDIMVETATTKVFSSEMSWRVVNDAMQIMGGEGYMAENELERIFRDSRIYTIVEGANEVMQSFIFAYGGKQLAEYMIRIKDRMYWESDEGFVENIKRITPNLFKPSVLKQAIPLGNELLFGLKRTRPKIRVKQVELKPYAKEMSRLIQELSYQFKRVSMKHQERIVNRQVVQARLSDIAMYLFAMSAVLSKLSSQLEKQEKSEYLKQQVSAGIHFMELAITSIRSIFREIDENPDQSIAVAALEMITWNQSLANDKFVIPEKSPIAAGSGRQVPKNFIPQFPGNGDHPPTTTMSGKKLNLQQV